MCRDVPVLGWLNMKIGRDIRAGDFKTRYVEGIEFALERIPPFSLLTKGRELVLPQQVRGEAIAVVVCRQFCVGHDVDFSVRLLEGLADFVLYQPLSPRQDFVRGRIQGMPNRELFIFPNPNWFVLCVDEPSVEVDRRNRDLFGSDIPNQVSGEGSDERMVQIAFTKGV